MFWCLRVIFWVLEACSGLIFCARLMLPDMLHGSTHHLLIYFIAVFQALGIGSARGYLIPQRRCGRVLVCDPPHPNAFASGHVHAWGTLFTLVLAGGRIMWRAGGGLCRAAAGGFGGR